MGAFYVMTYHGRAGAGVGAIYIGGGKIVGADAGGGRYRGSYVEQNGRLALQAIMSFPRGGALVTGQQMPANTQLALKADWPADFGDGSPQTLFVEGQPVAVAFEKVDDVP
jgi:hypothetical protein